LARRELLEGPPLPEEYLNELQFLYHSDWLRRDINQWSVTVTAWSVPCTWQMQPERAGATVGCVR